MGIADKNNLFAEFDLDKIAELKKAGLKEKELADHFGLSISEFRKCRSSMLKQRWQTQLEICKRMKERGMSRREMAELIGVSQSTIRSWLNAG
jgi:transposase